MQLVDTKFQLFFFLHVSKMLVTGPTVMKVQQKPCSAKTFPEIHFQPSLTLFPALTYGGADLWTWFKTKYDYDNEQNITILDNRTNIHNEVMKRTDLESEFFVYMT